MGSVTEEAVAAFLQSNHHFLQKWIKDQASENVRKDIISWVSPPSPELVETRKFAHHGRNSISSSYFKNYVDGVVRKRKVVEKNRNQLLEMSDSDLLFELIRDIASELDVNVLCHKILQNVNILTGSDRGSLFLAKGPKENRILVSKLFDVTNTSTLEESLHTAANEIKVPFGRGIVGYVAQTKGTVNIKDAYQDSRFNQDVDKKTGYRTHSILCMPIVNHENEVVGVAQIINKTSGTHEFSAQDEQVFRQYLMFCGIGLTNAQLFELSVQEYKRNKLLLQLAKGVFEEQSNLEKLVQKIMLESQDLLKCERCSVYLVDYTVVRDPVNEMKGKHEIVKFHSTKEVAFTKAFDLFAKDGGSINVPSAQELERSRNTEIAKHVVVNGESISVPDLEQDGRFGKGPFVDADGFKTKSILCMPIYTGDGTVIGVTHFINKLNGQPFDESDVSIIEAFSIFTGLGIHNCQMYENACRLMAKQTVALEIMSYHATAQQEETDKIMHAKIPSAKETGLYTFEFNDIPMSDDETVTAVIAMFQDAGIIQKFKVPYDVMVRWTCSVKKNYRPVTYHNWRHAFNVAQTMFTMLYTGELRPIFEDLEEFAMLVACLCHDLDHRGTNNAFQVKVASPLAMLYSTSVMEHHHFDHCIMILNSQGNNILQNLCTEDYKICIKTLEHSILSTDLALYFKKRGDFKKLLESEEPDFSNKANRYLLIAMMMTACDVAAITKPWEVQHQVAQLVANEFFEQGDIEKTQLGQTPIAMMDREKQDELPKMQVGFIDAICSPVYEMFAKLSHKLSPLYEGVQNNRKNWQALAEGKERAKKEGKNIVLSQLESEKEKSDAAKPSEKKEINSQTKEQDNQLKSGKVNQLKSGKTSKMGSRPFMKKGQQSGKRTSVCSLV